MLAALFLLVGCGRPFIPTKPFPAPVVADAVISMNFNADGGFFFADEEGEAMLTQPITFATLVESADLKHDDWMNVLGSFSIYTVKGQGRAWLCNQDFMCIEGLAGEKGKNAVFSINVGDAVMKQKVAKALDLFLADASGEVISGNAFKPLSALVQQQDPDKLKSLEVLATFTVFLIKGSRPVEICANNKCYCFCYRGNRKVGRCNRKGKCP
jgi:hypothetical protein